MTSVMHLSSNRSSVRTNQNARIRWVIIKNSIVHAMRSLQTGSLYEFFAFELLVGGREEESRQWSLHDLSIHFQILNVNCWLANSTLHMSNKKAHRCSKTVLGYRRGTVLMFICSKLGQNLSQMEVRTFVRIQRVILDHLLVLKAEIMQEQALFQFPCWTTREE